MTPIERFLQSLLMVDIWDLVKVFVVFGLGLYLVFAVVVVRQVQLMRMALNGALDVPLKLIASIHLLIAIGVFLAALIWL